MEYEGIGGMQRDCWLLFDLEGHCAIHRIHDLNHILGMAEVKILYNLRSDKRSMHHDYREHTGAIR